MTDGLIAPYLTGLDGTVDRRWEGRNTVKPWQRKITATFAHLETPQLVGYVIALLRLQTVRPHIIVVDTGSTADTCRQLEEHRAEDVEIHYVRSHGYQHSSQPVGVACDLAQALCQTEYMFWTHTDCFLRSRSYLEECIGRCTPATPVVGYQMSDRSWLTDQWAGMFSHTATVTHMPTWYRLGVTWSFERSHEQFGIPRTGGGWPDTETAPNMILRAAGVQPVLIGNETNYERFIDGNVDHCFAPETLIMTRDGTREIGSLVGEHVEVLTRGSNGGKWVKAPVESFGVQPLLRLTLARDSERREVFATGGHRWYVSGDGNGRRRPKVVTTQELTPGMRLESVTPRSYTSALSVSPFGAAQGFVFGDGTVDGKTSKVIAWGEKVEALSHYFEHCPTSPRTTPNGVAGREFRALPRHFKTQIPDVDESPSYIYGWLAGYFAADGNVMASGTLRLDSVNREALEQAQALCSRLGIGTYSIKAHTAFGYGRERQAFTLHLVPSDLTPEFFLRPSHRARFDERPHRKMRTWCVRDVTPTDRVEEVFCAVVPETGCFALAENLLTGNCRSYPGSLIYAAPYHAKAQKWVRRAMRDADARIRQWTRECNLASA